MADTTYELQLLVAEHVETVQLPAKRFLAQPPDGFLAQPPDERDPGQIPAYLHALDDLGHWLNSNVKGKLPLDVSRNHIQGSIAPRDEIHACYQALLRQPTSFINRAPMQPLERGGYVLDVDIDALEQLTKAGFTDTEIGQHLGCSRSTVIRRRRMIQLITKRQAKHLVSEDNLRELIINHQSLQDGEMLGYRTIQGHLNGQGVHVTREQVRELVRELNPTSTNLRRAVLQARRVYKVPFPNSLWHIDGQHKLIRWKFVIHGGVDGYSRVCVFMRARDNNRAETVGQLFSEAAEAWGWPQRVRVDYGGENYAIWRQMIAIRGMSACDHTLHVY
jgi:hypothetical protein